MKQLIIYWSRREDKMIYLGFGRGDDDDDDEMFFNG